MTFVKVRGRSVEVPTELMSAPAVEGFSRYLTSTGEMEPTEASRFTLAILGTILLNVGEWYAGAVGKHISAVMELRATLRARYVEALRLLGNGHTGELPEHLQPEAFRQLFADLAAHVDEISSPEEAIGRHIADVPLETFLHTEEAHGAGTDPHTAPDEARGLDPRNTLDPRGGGQRGQDATGQPFWLRSGDADAEQAFSNDLARRARQAGDLPAAGRGGGPTIPARAFAEAMAARLVQRYLRPAGIEVTSVARQPINGPFLAAEINLGALDPVRDLGYEIHIRVPAEMSGGRGEVWVRPDGYAFSGDNFEFLEFKSHEAVPPNGFFSGTGARDMMADLELRGRMASRIPGCSGWLYRTASPEMTEVFNWANRTLQGRGGAPPESASLDFVNAVNAAAADPATSGWARFLRTE